MINQNERTQLVIGKQAVEILKNSKVTIFGIGGVGSFVAEALARAGVGHLVLIDKDIIDITNLNRQIHALHSSIGKSKVEVMKERIFDINPKITVEIYQECFLPENESIPITSELDYVVDAVDMVKAKLEIIKRAKKQKVPVISCMGTGNKLHPEMLEITDIEKTSICPLAKLIRKEIRRENIRGVKVLYSKEEPILPHYEEVELEIQENEKKPVGSVSFVPSVAGLMIAGEVIRDLIRRK